MLLRYAVAVSAVLALGVHGGSGAPPPDAVEIHPDSVTSLDVAPYSTNTQRFWIKNTGTQTNQYSIFANVCTPYDLYCEWSNTFLGTIAPNDSVPLDVTFTAGHAGTSGLISFDARISTNQAVRATKNVTVNARQEMHLEVDALNPGAAEERDLCVTVAVATDAAYECGDLRLVHALPSVRARGTVRTPTLLYNSRFAHPFGLVQATLSTLPHDATNVTARLRVPRPSGDIVVSQGFSDALFTASSVQKFTLGFDASALPTGVYPYTLTTTFSIAGTPDSLSATGELMVVNRKTSPFGAGWWLAGYERIYVQGDGSLLWIGGDGSARHYDSVAVNVYKAPAIDRPDSITVESGNFVRHLRSGAKVEFASDGKHFATSDRLGLVTFFHHDQYGQMVHIDPAGFGSLRYDFTYSNSTGPLETVTAPPVGGVSRVVQRYVLSDGRILSQTDPDNTVEEFRFDNGAIPEQITRRINRRGIIQSFAFDAVGKFTSVRVPLNASDTAVTTFCPAESRGFVSTGCSSGPLHPDSAVTVMDGPRTDTTDVTTFRLDRFGAPKVIRDAFGNQTQLFRGDRTFPGLVTRVVYANGWTNDAFHDVKGLLTKLVQYAPLGPDRDAVTEYTWDPKWERPTSTTSAEGTVVRSGYDTTTGNQIWQESGRPGADTTYFRYYPAGGANAHLPRAVDAPADAAGFRAVDSLAYDSLGNLAEVRAGHAGVPSTIARVTRWLTDAVGRPVRVSADINASSTQQRRDSTGYDLRDRVVYTRASGVGTTPAQEFLQTTQVYDAEGNLRRLERSASAPAVGTPVGTLVSRWGYDDADRLIADTATDGQVETRAYDRAGNDTLRTTRRGHTVRMGYDALNRLQSRTLDTVTYLSQTVGIAAFLPNTVTENTPYPRRPIAHGLTAVGDTVIGSTTESFTYDAMGRLLTANNDDAQVQRTYFSNGLPETETLRIRAYGSSDFTSHTYVSGYEYDLDGRRTRVRYPQQVSAGATPSSTQYHYSQASGALDQVIDPLNATFVFHTDLRGQLDTLYLPGSITEAFGYDAAGRVLTDRMHNAGGSPLRLTSRTYDARDNALTSVNTTGALDSHTASYTGLGYLAASAYADHGTNAFGTSVAYTSTDTMTYDGLGNLFKDTTVTVGSTSAGYTRFDGERVLRYDSTTGRVRAMISATRQDTVRYDAAGNAELTYYPAATPSGMDDDRAVYYDALGRVRAVDHRIANGSAGLSQMLFTFEEFRYDALGRRVLARTRRFCRFLESVDCGHEKIRRTIWDGAQELAEIQMPGGDTVSSLTLENDTLPLANRRGVKGENGEYKDLNVFFGRVAYTHGVGLDQPLSVVRFDYADSVVNRPFVRWAPFSLVPHWNVRGEADNGSFSDGALSKCTTAGGFTRCVQVRWPFGWTATAQQTFTRDLWHGSLLEDKRDGSGLLFRRNRYMDPATGRFTQEDPIGLAGGLNLYGFASGDPVNFDDPFGLDPIDRLRRAIEGLAMILTTYGGGKGPLVDIYEHAETIPSINSTAKEAEEEAGRVAKNVRRAAGGSGTDPLKRAGSKALQAGARGGTKLLPVVGVVVDVLTSFKHGENESLPEMVCRIEKCDPTIRIVPDQPKK